MFVCKRLRKCVLKPRPGVGGGTWGGVWGVELSTQLNMISFLFFLGPSIWEEEDDRDQEA